MTDENRRPCPLCKHNPSVLVKGTGVLHQTQGVLHTTTWSCAACGYRRFEPAGEDAADFTLSYGVVRMK